MLVVGPRTFHDATIAVDDREFVDCRFVRCHFTYNGGLFRWTRCSIDDCTFTIGGDGVRVIDFLYVMGVFTDEFMRIHANLQ